MRDVMLDLETLGTRSTSAIIQMGACFFDRTTGEIGYRFIRNIHLTQSNLNEFTVDYHTIKWWMRQSDEARTSLFHDSISIKEAVIELDAFLRQSETIDALWSHATFDIPLITHAFEVHDMPFPVGYHKMRDIRTIMDIAQHHGDSTAREGIHHNALDDCMFQAKYVVEALNKIKITI